MASPDFFLLLFPFPRTNMECLLLLGNLSHRGRTKGNGKKLPKEFPLSYATLSKVKSHTSYKKILF